MAEFSDLEGKTIVKITSDDIDDGSALHFFTDNGLHYEMYHCQDCCEHVRIEDICGNLDDLIGSPVVSAYESCSINSDEGVENIDSEFDRSGDESFTWTFYNISTTKGSVTIRWYGSSNGYYSESVSFYEVKGVRI